jgi:hypothetical protein
MTILTKSFVAAKFIISIISFLFGILTLIFLINPEIKIEYIQTVFSGYNVKSEDAGEAQLATVTIAFSVFVTIVFGIYFLLSSLYELKNKEPFNLFLRIFLNILPALSFIFFRSEFFTDFFPKQAKHGHSRIMLHHFLPR